MLIAFEKRLIMKQATKIPLPIFRQRDFVQICSAVFISAQRCLRASVFERKFSGFYYFLLPLIAACAAARRAIGTRNGEQET